MFAKFIWLITILICCGRAQVSEECFLVSPAYGSLSGFPHTDRSNLRSSNFIEGSYVSKIKFCGTALQGIQLTLYDDATAQSQNLGQLGRTTTCLTWDTPRGSFVQEVLLGYKSTDVTYMQVTYSNGVKRQRGTLGSTDLRVTEQFTRTEIWVGIHGFEQSDVLKALGVIRYICGGTVPKQPTAVTTRFSSDTLIVSWSAPEDDGGLKITAYKVVLRSSDQTQFYEELSHCAGSQFGIVELRECAIPAALLAASPFNLPWGSEVVAKVSALNIKGESSQSEPGGGGILVASPKKPTNLAEVSSLRSSTTLGLKWDDGSDTGGLPIEKYRITLTAGTSQTQFQSTQRQMVLTGLDPGTTYTITVEASNANGYSAPSDSISLLCAYKPLPPQAVSSKNQANLVYFEWSEPNANGSPITGYRVFIQQQNTNFREFTGAIDTAKRECSLGLDKLEVSPYLLNVGQNIIIKVIAINLYGESDFSQLGTGATMQKVPDAPISLQVVTQSDKQITIMWSEGASSGGSPIISYSVRSDKGSSTTFDVVASSIQIRQYTNNFVLVPGVTYRFQVYARNSVGESLSSTTLAVVAARAPDAPLTPTTQQVNQTVVVEWRAPYNGGSQILSYQVNLMNRQGDFVKAITVSGTTQNAVASVKFSLPITSLRDAPYNLDWGFAVIARVSAINLFGTSAESEGQGAILKTNPSEPLGLEELASQRNATTLAIKWTQPTFLGGDSTVTYSVQQSEDGVTFRIVRSNINELQAIITGLIAGTTYSFRVRAQNSYGSSGFSSTLSLKCAWLPSMPRAPTTAIIGDKVQISWIRPNQNGSPILQYQVFMVDKINFQTTLICETAELSCLVPLQTLTQYPFLLQKDDLISVSLAASNQYGTSPLSLRGGNSTMIVGPDPPTSLKLLSSSSKSISFTWSDGGSNGGAPIIDYQIFMDGQFVKNDPSKNRTFTTNQSLIADQSYSFYVTARNQAGQSSQSETLIAVAANRPAAPTMLQNDPENTNAYQIGLKWQQTDDGGTPVLNYEVSVIYEGLTQYQIVKSDLIDQQTIITGLTPGIAYRFIVKARNRIGQSDQSNSVVILAAQAPYPPTQLSNIPSLTGKFQVGLQWKPPSFDGGSQIVDYRVWSDQANNTFVLVGANITSLNYVVRSLRTGIQYQFKLQARNSLGLSDFSEVIKITTAAVPMTPLAPTTTLINEEVIIKWAAPDDNGSPITSYTILIRKSDLTFAADLKNCQGSEPTIRDAAQCTIPVSVLRAAPFSIPWGSKVFAKIVATNKFGSSEQSIEGEGATLITTADPPLNLLEDSLQRSKTSLGLKWSASAFTGGAPLQDYIVSMSQGAEFIPIAQNITNLTYVVQGLTAGLTYRFVVQARTIYGVSAYSDQLTLVCAFRPEAPNEVRTTNNGDKISVSWSQPVTNGSPITQYKVFVRQAITQVFIQERVECAAAVTLRTRACLISLTTLAADPFNLAAGQSILVQIIATNQYGDSLAVQSSLNNGAIVYTVPDAPIGLMNDAVATNDIQIKIKWRDGASNGGSSVLDYSVYYDQGNSLWVQLASGVTVQQYTTNVQLTANTVYQFRVSARNQVGESLKSQSESIRAAAKPASPAQITSIRIQKDASQLTLDWTAWATGSIYTGGSPIIDYRVSYEMRRLAGKRLRRLQEYQVFKEGITTTQYTVSGLAAGNEYAFVVQARNLVGFSEYSEPLTIVAAQVPDPPALVERDGSITRGDKIGIKWQAPGFTGGLPILDYKIFGSAESSSFKVLAEGVTTLQWSQSGALKGQTYRYTVQARNLVGFSESSIIVTVLAAETPGQPQPPTTVWSNNNLVTISWSAPDSGGSPITAYIVEVAKKDGSYQVSAKCSSALQTSCQLAVSDLRSAPFLLEWGSQVFAKVTALNSYGQSPQSVEGGGAILITNPAAPSNIQEQLASRTSKTLGISWDQPIFTGGTYILDYRLSYQLVGNSTWTVLAENVVAKFYLASNLKTGASYRFRVEARNLYGYSETSQVFTVLCASQPNTPFNVVSINTQSKIAIQWSVPQSNGSPITGYQIFIRHHSSQTYSPISCTETSSSSCEISSSVLNLAPFQLAQGEAVFAKVIAQNAYGNSPYSDAGQGAYMILVPDAPRSLQNDVTVTSDTKIKLTWQQGLSNGGAPITDYQVYYDSGAGAKQVGVVIKQEYVTDFDLQKGVDHAFRVTARNLIGESVMSEQLKFVANTATSGSQFFYVPQVTNLNETESSDNKMISAVAAAGSISAIAIIIAVVVTILVVVACSALALFVILRKYRVHPQKKTDQAVEDKDNSRLQDSEIKQINTFQITRVKIDELDDSVAEVGNIGNLKGKSVREKKQLLAQLEHQKQQKMQTQYQMERQQLRHDEIQANRRIQEQERIEDVFNAITGNENGPKLDSQRKIKIKPRPQIFVADKEIDELEQQIGAAHKTIEELPSPRQANRTQTPLFVRRETGDYHAHFVDEIGLQSLSVNNWKQITQPLKKINQADLLDYESLEIKPASGRISGFQDTEPQDK